MKESKALYIVCLCGLAIAAFEDENEAEKFRVRRMVNLHFESDFLNLLAFRETPATQIIRVLPSKEMQGYIFREGITLQRYSRNALEKSLDLREDLPEA